MPRPTYGPESKRRTAQLLTLLLDYANDELDLDEKALDRLRSQIQVHWQTDRSLIVRTKVRALHALSQLVTDQPPLTSDQIKEALRRLSDLLEILVDNRPHPSGSETWHFTLTLWCSRRDRAALLHHFHTEWEARRPLKSKQVAPDPREVSIPFNDRISLADSIRDSVTDSMDDLIHLADDLPVANLISPATPNPIALDSEIDGDRWQRWCHDTLTQQNIHRLTTNPLMGRDGITFTWQSLYVPLGVVARVPAALSDTPDLTPDDLTPEPVEEAPDLTPDDLLAHLCHPAPPAIGRHRIAIVGEPGTGKTTLLQKLAWGLLAHQQIPIWISLADLQTLTLEEFLLTHWLKLATRQLLISPELQQEFGTQVHQGRVWLLLDAVDEMALEASAALSAIARQLRGWLCDAHVVLTCRSQVWDNGKNGLDGFDSYSNLTFAADTPEPMHQFIGQWFSDRPVLGDRLQAQLAHPDRRRIRHTVQNPLCLALLCRAWSRHQGFPTTKSMLYQQFVEALYDWKQDLLPLTLTERQHLNQALGHLAIAALAHPQMRFRFPQSFVLQTWPTDGPESPRRDGLTLALQIGWLTPVGMASGSGEKLYAFYHPTFQEYFAAQAIADWPTTLGPDWLTQILAPEWREILSFWWGRADVASDQKEQVIQALIQFDDQAGGFYRYQAYFLAARGLADFPESPSASVIVAQLVQWRFGHAGTTDQAADRPPWCGYPPPVQIGSQRAAMHSDRALVTAATEAYLQGHPPFFARWQAAYSLGKTLSPGHPLAIQTLRQLIAEADSPFLQIRLCDALVKLNPADETAIAILQPIVQQTTDNPLRRRAAYSLGRILPDDPSPIAVLEHLAHTAEPKVQRQAVESLTQLRPDHPLAAPKGVKPPRVKRESRQSGDRPESSQAQEIAALCRKLQSPRHVTAQIQAANRLGRMVPGHPQAVQTLAQILQQPDQDAAIYRRAAEGLETLITEETLGTVITALRSLGQQVEAGNRSAQTLAAYRVLWQIAQQLPYAKFIQLWQSPT